MTSKANGGDIVIPELEEAAKTYNPNCRFWTEEEDAIVLKYYSIVPLEKLMKYLPKRSKHAIESRASYHGLRKR